jgi:hypothetical protein
MMLIILAAANPAGAQWAPNGVTIIIDSDNQTQPLAVPDGEGGAIIIWEDEAAYDLYAQRVDAFGNPLWGGGGIAVCTAVNAQYLKDAQPDGQGGAMVVWQDFRNGNWDIYAQRISGEGIALWTANGIPVCDQSSYQYEPVLVPHEDGGAIFAWEENRGSDTDIFAQRVDEDGNELWTGNGVEVCTALYGQYSPRIVSDCMSGAIVVWQDNRSSEFDIYAQRINYNGIPQWTADGRGVCTETDYQRNPVMVSDGTGGAFIAWRDDRIGIADIYAQRISSAGTSLWTSGGEPVCFATAGQYSPEIALTAEDEVVVIWRDDRFGYCDIYGQKIDGYGNMAWTANGIAICDEPGGQFEYKIIPDGDGNSIIVWVDYRSGYQYDIYAQLINTYGSKEWESADVPVTKIAGSQRHPSIASDGDGGAIAVWDDARTGIDYDIYAQRIERNGYWGYPAATITEIRDVPGDQGGYVNLAWDASRLDPWPEDRISYYSLWRAIDETAAFALMKAGAPLLSGEDQLGSDFPSGSVRMELLAGAPFYWEYIDQVYAYNLDSYSRLMETVFDSTASCTEYHYFQVISHYSSTKFWISEPDSGYSVDNIAPCPPLALEGEQSYSPEGLSITWNPNTEADIDHYRIYRGTAETFIPDPGNMIASQCDTLVFDGGWDWSSGYWYKVSAVDIHGNESEYSVLGPDMVTGDDTSPLPEATFLSQNYPNPFNPSTTIAFGLKEREHVSLRIYDAAGRLVRNLVDETRPAGRYEATWDGRGTNGHVAASGVYFYRLWVGEFEETRKMILLQ